MVNFDLATFDLAVIGAGPGGYVAAIRAAQLGKSVVIIERQHMGGVCLNWGCIPTKALLRSAEMYKELQHAEQYGLKVKEVSFDFAKIIKRSRDISQQLVRGIDFLMRKNKITTIMGRAFIENNNNIIISKEDGDREKILAKDIIIATGARAVTLPDIGLDPKVNEHVWTAREALQPKKLPKRIVVVGSGAIGIEFASFYNNLGSEVTIIEMQDRILPVEDREISDFAQKSFSKQGMKFFTGAKLTQVIKKGKVSKVEFIDDNDVKQTLTTDIIICAIGIRGNVENLGLEANNIKTHRNHIIIDEFAKTSCANIYAIGDVCGPPWLAHKASHEAVMCVDKIASIEGGSSLDVHALDVNRIPACTYSHPQIASIGLTEAQAKEKYGDISVGRFPFHANGKALALSQSEGLVKTIYAANSGQLVGAHLIGTEVTELISGYAIAMGCEATEAEIFETIFAHPTLSEMIHESSLEAFDQAIHI